MYMERVILLKMKLQHKINIRFLLVTLVVFVLAGVLFYFALGKVTDQNINEMLISRKASVITYLQNISPDSISPKSADRTLFIYQVPKTEIKTVISDTIVFDEGEKDYTPCRVMVFTTEVKGQCYKVTILQSLLESEDLQAIIIYFMILLFILLTLALFFLNRWLSSKAWEPFFTSTLLLKSWKIGENKQVHFEGTGIAEFDQLNRTLEEMIEKMQSDYVTLKEFTENASHEIQTPLAIIKSKLELLLDNTAFKKEEHKQIHAIYETANRLSKLNEALLLLAKIENHQFPEMQEIDLAKLTKSRLEALEELFVLKKIEVTRDLSNPFIVTINPLLADILVNNLLSNALKHNFVRGKIIISSSSDRITFSNTGSPLSIDPQRIFNRLVKQNTSEESSGLGLAIAKRICISHQILLDYSYSDQLHHFLLRKED